MRFFFTKDPRKDGIFANATFVLVVMGIILVCAIVLGIRQAPPSTGFVVIDDTVVVDVVIADTPASWEQGLSGSDPLGADEGMVFLFPTRSRYAFWMKDMRFPIDIIWITDGEIMDITANVPVPTEGDELVRYFPLMPVDTVLEVRAGFAVEHGLRTGIPVRLEVDNVETLR